MKRLLYALALAAVLSAAVPVYHAALAAQTVCDCRTLEWWEWFLYQCFDPTIPEYCSNGN